MCEKLDTLLDATFFVAVSMRVTRFYRTIEKCVCPETRHKHSFVNYAHLHEERFGGKMIAADAFLWSFTKKDEPVN